MAAGEDVEDPRIALALEGSRAGIAQQEATLDNLRTRAATLTASAAVSASFLGAATFGKSQLPLASKIAAGAAVLALVIIIYCAVAISWPRKWALRINGTKILSEYVDHASPLSIDETRRALTLTLDEDHTANADRLGDLWALYRNASIALGAEVVAWIIALAVR